MKARLLFALSLLVPFTLVFIYVWTTAAEVPFRDDIYLIKGGFVESYCNGSLSLADFWRASAGTRLPGYLLLQFINIKWFGMNSKLIVLLIPFLMSASAFLIYREYRKSLSPQRSPEFIAATFVIPNLVIFNLIQWEGLTFSYGFVFQSPMPFFIATFLCLELFLTNEKPNYWPAAFITTALAILIFGGSHSFSFAPALGTTFICYVLTHRTTLKKEFWKRFFAISIFMSALALLYLNNIHKNNYFPDTLHHVDKVLSNPLEALLFLSASFGASVVGVDVANTYFSFQGMVILGCCVVLLYIMGGYLFIKVRMYKKTYLPFYLLVQSFFYLVFMMLGRFGYGINYGMASRYTCVSVYGLVALVWLLIFILSYSEDAKIQWRTILYAPVMLIFTGILLTSLVEWRIQPYRKANFQELHQIALQIDKATDKKLSRFEERPTLVRQSLMILKDCQLNIYRMKSPNCANDITTVSP